MNFSEYKISFFKRWQRRIIKACWSLFCIILTVEMLVLIYYLFNNEISAGEVFHYTVLRIICPSSINFIMLLITSILLGSEKISITAKNNLVMYSFLVLMITVSIFHNRYPLVLILPCTAIFLSSLLTDKHLINKVFIASMTALVISVFIWNMQYKQATLVHQIIMVMISFIVHIVSYILSRDIFSAQQSQIHFIYDCYMRQRELTDELRIEPLTRLYNRTAYESAINRYIKFASESGVPVMQALIDLDNFKEINDKYGHASGDDVLISLSKSIVKIFGGNRNAFRYGGDEFVILFKDMTCEQVQKLIDKLRYDFECTWFDFMDKEARCTMSIGIAAYHKGWNSKQWFEAADQAVYNAKARGKNQFVFTM